MSIYGQATGIDGYMMVDPPFAYWMPQAEPFITKKGRAARHPWLGGYKVHVSVELGDAERIA